MVQEKYALSDAKDLGGELENRMMLDLLPDREPPDTSVACLQAALMVDAMGRALFAAERPSFRNLSADKVVGKDWRELFAEFDEIEIESEPEPDTFFFRAPDEDGAIYRVRKLCAAPIPGTAGGYFILIEAVADPAAVQELIYREKMVALGQIAAGVAHEVNNPLTTISGWIQIMLSQADENDKRRAPLKLMSQETSRIANIIHHLLTFGRRTPSQEEPVAVNGLLSDVLALVGYQIRGDDIEIVTDLCPGLPCVTGDANQLKQVFLNIIVNARQAMPDGGVLTIRTRVGADGAVEASLSDTGCGMSPEIEQRVFEPFYTTKGDTGGSGIGLFLCRNIVKDHGGTLSVASRPGEGSTFIITLPAASAETVSGAGAAADMPHRAHDDSDVVAGAQAGSE